MSGIVERLRNYAKNVALNTPVEHYLTWQAADEIERLRAALQEIMNGQVTSNQHTIDHARRALEENK